MTAPRIRFLQKSQAQKSKASESNKEASSSEESDDDEDNKAVNFSAVHQKYEDEEDDDEDLFTVKQVYKPNMFSESSQTDSQADSDVNETVSHEPGSI